MMILEQSKQIEAQEPGVLAELYDFLMGEDLHHNVSPRSAVMDVLFDNPPRPPKVELADVIKLSPK